MRDGKKFTPQQPIEGERVALCGHKTPPCHFYFLPVGIDMQRPDGTSVTVTWIILCQACHEHERVTHAPPEIRGDGVWKGNAPFVEEAS